MLKARNQQKKMKTLINILLSWMKPSIMLEIFLIRCNLCTTILFCCVLTSCLISLCSLHPFPWQHFDQLHDLVLVAIWPYPAEHSARWGNAVFHKTGGRNPTDGISCYGCYCPCQHAHSYDVQLLPRNRGNSMSWCLLSVYGDLERGPNVFHVSSCCTLYEKERVCECECVHTSCVLCFHDLNQLYFMCSCTVVESIVFHIFSPTSVTLKQICTLQYSLL